MNAPISYPKLNLADSSYIPGVVHAADTYLTQIFTKYLFQKIMARYDWTIPQWWDKTYFQWTLYVRGFISVFNKDEYGVIPQHCTLYGRNIYYMPTNCLIQNPIFKQSLDLKIHEDCEIIHMMPGYGSCWDLVTYYAQLMATVYTTIGVNAFNSKLSFAFFADNKAQAESLKAFYDKVSSGEPAVVIDSKLRRDTSGELPRWEVFQQNVGQNYIVDRAISDVRKIEAEFDTIIGIQNANTDKKERLISDEVNANNAETLSRAMLWLETMQECCERVRSMFSLTESELNVSLRKLGVKNNAGMAINNGAVQI